MDNDSFYIKVNGIVYEIVPEEGNTFTIFKNGSEYTQILRNKNKKWMRIDYKTDEPIVEENKEVEDIGRLIDKALKLD
ncbi:MAG: hypothetical protein K2P75_06450 [Sphingobacteriaceae bacterium]|nr:hypothetical protein [Sphingobacteriaceae bacterium]